MSVIRKYPLSLMAAVLLCSLGGAEAAAQNDAAGGAGRSNEPAVPSNGDKLPPGQVPVGTLTRTSWEEVERSIHESAQHQDEPAPSLAKILRQIRASDDLSQRRTLIMAYLNVVKEFPQEQKKAALLKLTIASAPRFE